MPNGRDQCAQGAQEGRRLGALVALLLSIVPAGCSSNNPLTTAGTARTATIAFEAIEGPPPVLAQKLVQAFDDRARARQVIVVSREGLPHYRVRGQFAARNERGRTTIAWVWDVYDAQNRRVLHITGEEVPGPAGRDWGRDSTDSWASVDEEAVGRIAQGGVEPLVAFLASPSAIAATEAAPPTPVAVTDDFTPEASGIFRVFRSVWPKSEDKKPAGESPAQAPGAPAARPEPRAGASERPTAYSAVPASPR